MMFLDRGEGDDNSREGAATGEESGGISYDVVRGRLYIDIPDTERFY